MSNNKAVIQVDENYAISFPEDRDCVEETENGELSILVDIYKIVNGKHTKTTQEDITPELQAKIEAFVNEMLLQAIDYEKYEKRLKK